MSNFQKSDEPVEIWIRIEKDHNGYPESQDWEDLWAWPMSDGTFKIDSAPFFATGIAAGDLVTTVQTHEGFTSIDRIVHRSGHSTFRIWLNKDLDRTREQIVCDLQNLGAKIEITLDRLLAIDAEPQVEAMIWGYLKDGEQRNMWSLQVGHSPD